MPEDEPEIIARLLQFLYTGSYDLESPPPGLGLPEEFNPTENTDLSSAPEASLQVNRQEFHNLSVLLAMHAAADKFGVEDLRNQAAESFKETTLDNLSLAQLRDLLKVAYTTCPSAAAELKEQIYAFCLKTSFDIHDKEYQMIIQHESLHFYKTGCSLGNELRAANTKIKTLENKISDLSDEVERWKRLYQQSEANHDEKARYYEKVIDETNRLTRCATCGKEYNCAPYRRQHQEHYEKTCQHCGKSWIVKREF